HKKPFKYASKEFLFRGLITCAVSGKVVSSDTKKKVYKNGNVGQWTYLICHDPENPKKQKWVREEKVIAQVADIFKSLHIPSDILTNVVAYIRDTDQTEREFLSRQISDLQRESTKIQNRLDTLMDLMLDGVIPMEDYHAKRASLMDKREHTDNLIKRNRAGDEGFKNAIISLVSLSSDAYELFKGSTIDQKRQLINFVFSNLQLKGTTLCYSLKKPFDQFINLTNCQEWRALIDDFRIHNNSREIIVSQFTSLEQLKEGLNGADTNHLDRT
ncbi:MAG: hypothetical protein AAF969_18330, partial [Bacteroidota bacterium]